MKILVTGCAGFIGFHLTKKLLEAGHTIQGFDNINDYYSVDLKKARLENLRHPNFEFFQLDIATDEFTSKWTEFKPDYVYHLAAQAGVRASLTHPESYIHSNLQGFFKVIEAARHCPPKHLIYASSSSVYGNTAVAPFKETDPCNHPISLYAATKKSNELMAYTYSHLFQVPVTGLRFFTVYGSWGRPDMAYYSFSKNLLEGKEIQLFEAEKQRRDFTHISDVVESLVRLKELAPAIDAKDKSAARILNIGAQNPIPLLEMISTMEEVTGKKFKIKHMPLQKGEVSLTYSDSSALHRLTGYSPKVPFKEGYSEFYRWFQTYSGL